MDRTELIEHLIDGHEIFERVARSNEMSIEQLWAGHNGLHLKAIGKPHEHKQPEAE